jgi:hypothetical protein
MLTAHPLFAFASGKKMHFWQLMHSFSVHGNHFIAISAAVSIAVVVRHLSYALTSLSVSFLFYTLISDFVYI